MRINLKVPADTSVIGIEETPPPGWTKVIEVSDGGAYDALTHRVKWGPFFAPDIPAQIAYRVGVPDDFYSIGWFDGLVSLDGHNTAIGGNTYLFPERCQLMPADSHFDDCAPCAQCSCGTCNDGRIELCELVGYACKWQRGCHDHISFVTRAAYLWLNGEIYCFDEELGNWDAVDDTVDLCGCCSESSFDPGPLPTIPLANHAHLEVVRQSRAGEPLRTTSVTTYIKPLPVTTAMALEVVVPPGWEVTSIAAHGAWDAVHRKVKWGPFLDGAPTELTFHVAHPTALLRTRPRAAFAPVFRATIAFDGVAYPVSHTP